MGRRKLCGIASVFLCKVSTYKEPFGGTLLVWYWGPPLYSRESQLTKVSLAQDTSYEIDTKVACCVYEVSENKNCILVHLERERPCQRGDSLSHHMNICDAMPIKIESPRKGFKLSYQGQTHENTQRMATYQRKPMS